MRTLLLKYFQVSPESMICSSENSVPQIIKDDDNVVLTKMADASRAIVGNNSVAENYSFVGVHHIFDQVKLLSFVVLS